MMAETNWPSLDLAAWEPTKRSLHLYAQMLGKIRLALAPHQPNFTFTSLALTPRGFTTGVMPFAGRSIQASVDVFDARLSVESSDGGRRTISLAAPTSIARVFVALHAALDELGVEISISPIPQEIPDQTPLDRDDRPAIFDRADAARWLTVMSATNAVFDRWRAHFFGRSSIQLWWGAFDFALLLFSGRHVPAPTDRGYLLRYDLDAEMMNAGFYPGDAANPAMFYAYVYPQPAACSALAIQPSSATWSQTLGEWVLPYETVRRADDPVASLTAFLDSIYHVCGASAGWNHAEYVYTPPPLRRAPDTHP